MRGIKNDEVKKIDNNEEALEALLTPIPNGVAPSEDILTEDAVGRVLSEEVSAGIDNPPYSRSTADGHVILASGTALASPQKPITFEVKGDIPPPSQSVDLLLGHALKVKNGGYMAIKRFLEGYYSVLKESEVSDIHGWLSVTRRVEKHENIIVQGSLLKIGNILFQKGHRLRPRDFLTLAGQGILTVNVIKQPKVAIFSTGDELMSPKEPYKIGYKYDANSYGLAMMVKESGGLPQLCGIMPDQLIPFSKKLVEILLKGEVDLVIISGGTAAGGRRFTVDLINEAGRIGRGDSQEGVDTMKGSVVAAKKIEPNVLGFVAQKPVICLAGQPDQVEIGFRTFVRPVIKRLLGEKKGIFTDMLFARRHKTRDAFDANTVKAKGAVSHALFKI